MFTFLSTIIFWSYLVMIYSYKQTQNLNLSQQAGIGFIFFIYFNSALWAQTASNPSYIKMPIMPASHLGLDPKIEQKKKEELSAFSAFT